MNPEHHDYIDLEKVRKFAEKEKIEKIKAMPDVELSKALNNAQNALGLLIQEEQGEGKLTYKPSEHKEKKRELQIIIEAIKAEQKERLVIKR